MTAVAGSVSLDRHHVPCRVGRELGRVHRLERRRPYAEAARGGGAQGVLERVLAGRQLFEEEVRAAVADLLVVAHAQVVLERRALQIGLDARGPRVAQVDELGGVLAADGQPDLDAIPEPQPGPRRKRYEREVLAAYFPPEIAPLHREEIAARARRVAVGGKVPGRRRERQT